MSAKHVRADVMPGPEFRLSPLTTAPGDRLAVSPVGARSLVLRPVGAARRASIGVVMNRPAALPTK